jgi:F-type H+-transporting ATPase subunit a
MPHIGEAIEYSLKVPTPLLMSWVTVLVLFVVSWLAVRRLRESPGRLQAVFETCFSFIFDMVDSSIGPEGKSFYPLFLGLFLYILVGNLIGIVPGLSSPTANLNTTIALALVTFFSTHFFGIKKQGFFRYIGHFVAGVPLWLKPLMFIIEMIGELARPLSLSFRLFGNIMAKELLLGILAFLVVLLYSAGGVVDTAMTIVPLLLRPLIILLALLVGFIQAFIFTLLSIVYVGGAVKEHAERSH